MSYQNFKVKNGLSVNDVEVIDGSGNLVGPASSTSNSASSYANSAYAQANTGTILAQAAFDQANTGGESADSFARITANSAYAQANTATTNTSTADQRAVTSGDYANSAFEVANTALSSIPSLSGYATEGYVSTLISNLVDSAPTTLDTLNELAAALGDDANFATTVSNTIGVVGSYANSAYAQANTVDQRAVTSGSYANSAYVQANSAYAQANTATTNAATADQKAVSAGSYANSSFAVANTANVNATSAGSYANSAFSISNTATTNAATADQKAVSAGSYANSAFDTANTKFNSTGGFITGFANVSSNISVGTYIDFANDVEDPTYKEGRLYYDPGSKSVAYYNDSSSYIHIGQDVVTRVWNNSGATLPRANCVFISGESSANGFPNVLLASAGTRANAEVIGLTTTDIPNGGYGFVLISGRLQGLNTSAIPEGSELFLSATEPGKFTTSVPDTPNVPLNIGYITNSDLTQGVLLVNIHLMEGRNKTTGSILFARDSKIDQDNADLYWDYENHRLGIGTNNPTANLHVIGSGLFTGNVTISGNLLVSNAQSITTSQLTVGGNTIILNDAVTGTPTSNADIIVNRGTSANVYIRWAEDINEWVMFEDGGYPEGHILHSEKTFSTWSQYASAAAYEKSTHPVGGDLANTTNETAKSGFETANIASSHAVAGYNQANTATTNAATADQKAVSAGSYANSAFEVANTASVNALSAGAYANAAFSVANTDVTSISVSDGVYGNATIIPVITVSANGRIASISNTEILIAGSQWITTGSDIYYSNGNVGIGTSSPTNTTGYTTLHLNNNTNGGLLRITGANATKTLTSYVNTSGAYLGTITNDFLSFQINNAEAMRLRTSGGISFGSTGTAYGTSGQVLQSNGDAAPTWVDQSSLSAGSAITASTATIASSLNSASGYQVQSFGVGTAPSGTSGEIRATNNITAYFSDERFKTNLGNIPNALAKLQTLNGFYYEPNELAQSYGYEVRREVGVSAQQVQAIMPEVVAPAPIDDKYLTVRYERLVPLLIEAIKELSEKIDKLENKK
jgi:hypothetical protein